jgi:type II secretion system protein N
MRLPQLQLPRLSFEWLGAFGHRMTWLYIAYTSVLFVIFLLLTFPTDLLVRRAISMVSAPGEIEFSTSRFAWHRGFELAGLRLPPPGEGRPPVIELNHLWVRPLLSALLRGNPYALRLEADLYGGVAAGDINLSNGRLVGALEWQSINIARYPNLTSWLEEGRIAGRISGRLDFEGRGLNLDATQGSGEIVLDDAEIIDAKVDGFSVPNLGLSQTRLKFTIRGGRLEIQELNATGDVNVQGSGQIVLRTPFQDSALNLRATLQPTASTPDALRALMAMIPRPPGAKPDAPMTIAGTIASPRIR